MGGTTVLVKHRLAAVLVLGLSIGAILPASATEGEYELVPVVTGLSQPVGVERVPGDARLYVVEKGGRIRVVEDGRVVGTFLDISGLVATNGERGLLGVAFHPDYPSDPRVYVDYTDTVGRTQVVEYRARSDRNSLDPASAKALLTISQPASNHNGGDLEFGPDGYLYIASGDGGGSTGHLNGQDTSTLLGGILRMDVDTGSAPASNPFVGRPGADLLWAYGLRNPWRFTIDATTGNVIIADVGQSRYEEVDLAHVSEAGVNFGWSRLEGTACYSPATNCSTPGARNPIEVYSHATGWSITGGIVYHGRELVGYDGHYFYADWGSGILKSFRIVDGKPSERTDWTSRVGATNRIVAFGTDADGELLLVSISGTIWRLSGPTSPVGRVERLEVSSGGVAVVGWTFDPSVPGMSIPVHVYVDGRFAGGGRADAVRADVNRVFGISGGHGFRVVVAASAGSEVCVFGINDGDASVGGHTRLGCETVG